MERARRRPISCGFLRRKRFETERRKGPILSGYAVSKITVLGLQLLTSRQNELYVSPSWDVNPLASINGKAKISSLDVFLSKHPQGKIARNSPDYGKTFVCRRGCNTRTATYTDEFIWEEIYQGGNSVAKLVELVEAGTKQRRRRKVRSQSPQDGSYHPPPPQTPSKTGRSQPATPTSRRSQATPGSRGKRSVTLVNIEMIILISIQECKQETRVHPFSNSKTITQPSRSLPLPNSPLTTSRIIRTNKPTMSRGRVLSGLLASRGRYF